MNYLYMFLAALVINIIMFIPAYILQTDKLTDISYALSFVALAGVAYVRSGHEQSHILLLCLVVLWAFRLGSYLFARINRMGRDKRFDGMREHFWKFSRFWILQGSTVFVVLLAALSFWNTKNVSVGAVSMIGVAIFLAGLVLESFADAQKARFAANPKNKGKWIDEGVWSVSRHPNYLGEMMVWIGLYVFCAPSLMGSMRYVGLISPLYIVSLLLFVSGIPLLEKAADAKWGSDKKYQDYKKRVPVLLPSIRREKAGEANSE